MKAILGLLLGFASAAVADDRMRVQLPALLDPVVAVDPDVSQECKLPALVGDRVFEQLKLVEPGATAAPAFMAADRFVRLRITAARMIPAVQIRRLTVTSEIVEGDRVIAKASFRDSSAAMPGYGITLCDIMDKIATGVGKKAAGWVRSSYAEPAPQNQK